MGAYSGSPGKRKARIPGGVSRRLNRARRHEGDIGRPEPRGAVDEGHLGAVQGDAEEAGVGGVLRDLELGLAAVGVVLDQQAVLARGEIHDLGRAVDAGLAAEEDGIGPVAAGDDVGGAGGDQVVAVATVEVIRLAVIGAVGAEAIDGIVAPAAEQRVFPCPAVERVGAVVAMKRVVAFAAPRESLPVPPVRLSSPVPPSSVSAPS